MTKTKKTEPDIEVVYGNRARYRELLVELASGCQLLTQAVEQLLEMLRNEGGGDVRR